MAGEHKFQHCRELFKEMKILTLFSLYIYQNLIYVRENLDKINYRGDIHHYNTRSRSLLNLAQNRLYKTDKKPLTLASKLYNVLPLKIRELSDREFKLRLKNFLCNKAFYSVKEFEGNSWRIRDFYNE